MALATIRNVIYNDKHYLDGVKVIRPAQLLDVAPERNTNAFANMAE
ncbi:hypothetical protein I4J22_07600 [Corynebacterium diphtheriae]|nr:MULTISPECIES: hypothetical protein [Corynebacterium]AEX78106.1 hypothetical protein CDHC03_0375 [Corynebacterium diphtheriae HC03]AEX80350.1 hypothetical protein CDHC04_0357 [Corynebacterium diphtheriae HC04]AEX82609.1 hypothetical protein CDVA01_0340 [Corynebacterium diphtheriae VA01]MBG9227944.1 hypothetical protein [Corynebacterium diphtheriae bv. gravis]MBG9250877.1 hypothetical protein [Corynebacterium diphtheriae bv. mitis]